MRYIDEDFECKTPLQRKLPVSDALLTPPELSTNIVARLNGDCLDEIFQYLDVDDLCTFGSTCKRFYKQVNGFVRQKHHEEVHRFSSFKSKTQTPLWRLEDYLRNVGHMYTKANVANTDNNARVDLGLVGEFCKNVTELWAFVANDTHSWHDYQEIFNENAKIQILKLRGQTMNASLPPMKIPQLKKCRINHMHIQRQPSTVEFFRLNNQLQTLVLDGVQISGHDLFRSLSDSLKTLCVRENIFDTAANYLQMFVNAGVFLENIIIMIRNRYYTNNSILCRALDSFPKLKVLRLYDNEIHRPSSGVPLKIELGFQQYVHLRALFVESYADGMLALSFKDYP